MLIHSLDALAALRDDWDALAVSAGSPLLDHDWQLACAETWHSDGTLQVLAIREAGQLVAAAPLAFDPSRWQLGMLGAATLFEPTDCLTASDTAADRLAEAVIRLRRPSVFARIPRDGRLALALRRNAWPHAVTVDRPVGASNAVTVRSSWETFLGGLSSRTRCGLDRHRQQMAAAHGTVRLASETPAAGDVATVLEGLANLEASGWKGRNGSSLADRADLRRFFMTYGQLAAARRQLLVTTLTVGTTLAAMELAIVAHGRVWGLKVAYAESLAKYAPALQVIHASIRAVFEQGLAGYEFLGSAEGWQDRWHPDRRDHVVSALYPVTVPGLLHAALDVRATLTRRLATSIEPRH